MPQGCPWSGWAPPTIDWCEAELCAWVTNPADTWSNLAYVLVGVWMILANRRARGLHRDLRWFGPASILVGLLSGVYHASFTFFLQFFDFVGMFLFIFLSIAECSVRLGWVAPRARLRLLVGGTLSFSALVPLLAGTIFPIQGLVALLIAVAALLVTTMHRRGRGPADVRPFAVGLALLAAGGVCSLLDVTRVWCDPDDHWLQGHALWHVLTAFALLAFYRYFAGEGSSAQSGPSPSTATM